MSFLWLDNLGSRYAIPFLLFSIIGPAMRKFSPVMIPIPFSCIYGLFQKEYFKNEKEGR